MRHKIAAILVALAALLGVGLTANTALATVSAPAQVQVTEDYQDDPYLTGGRYRTKDICIWQTYTNSAYNAGGLGNSFEPAINTGWRSATQGCSGYPDWQVLRVALYSLADGHCTKWTGTSNPASLYSGHPMNNYYNRVWDGTEYPTVWINQYYNDSCWFTYANQDKYLGREMANVLGLQPHCSYVSGTLAIANACLSATSATALDRNRLTVLMNP